MQRTTNTESESERKRVFDSDTLPTPSIIRHDIPSAASHGTRSSAYQCPAYPPISLTVPCIREYLGMLNRSNPIMLKRAEPPMPANSNAFSVRPRSHHVASGRVLTMDLFDRCGLCVVGRLRLGGDAKCRGASKAFGNLTCLTIDVRVACRVENVRWPFLGVWSCPNVRMSGGYVYAVWMVELVWWLF
jgi:hypothetical protein